MLKREEEGHGGNTGFYPLLCPGGLWSDLLMEETVWGAIGCHPKCASQYDLQAEESLKVMIKHRKVVALGEIGLDYSGT